MTPSPRSPRIFPFIAATATVFALISGCASAPRLQIAEKPAENPPIRAQITPKTDSIAVDVASFSLHRVMVQSDCCMLVRFDDPVSENVLYRRYYRKLDGYRLPITAQSARISGLCYLAFARRRDGRTITAWRQGSCAQFNSLHRDFKRALSMIAEKQTERDRI